MWSFWISTGAIIGAIEDICSNVDFVISQQLWRIVDPGAPYAWFNLPTIPTRHYPISRDMGCLLYEVCSSTLK